MKKFFVLILMIVSSLFSVSCTKDALVKEADLVGEWNCVEVESGITSNIWLSFAADGSFELYQQIGDGVAHKYRGVYSLDAEGVLSGIYSDNKTWKYEYSVTLKNNTLTMTATTNKEHVTIYTKGSIPQEIREKCLEMTKSSAVEEGLRFL